MFQSLAQVRKWLVVGVCVLVAIVTLSYWIARSRVGPTLHNVPSKLGFDIQQTSDGFSLSKSEAGRTIYTIRASKAVQFKQGGHADLRNVHIVVYGRTHDRFDQIYGNQFTYDPQSGEIKAIGEVHIDLQGNAEGPLKPDQAQPAELKNPVHLLTRSLTFNQKTGIAETDEVVDFRTEQATGSAKGAYYDSKSNELQLKSDVHIVTTGNHPATITGTSGLIQKVPRQAILLNAQIEQPDRTLTADQATLLFEPDNTVQHVIAEGNVHIQVRGVTVIDVVGPRGDLNMGPKNSIQQAILSGGAKFDTHGASVAHGSADTFVIDFEDQNQPSRFHMIKNARMRQDPQPQKSGTSGQPMEIAADQLDFQLANGNQIKTGDTLGKASITILPKPAASRPAKNASNSGEDMEQLDHGSHRRQVPFHLRRQQSPADAARLAEFAHRFHHARSTRQGQHGRQTGCDLLPRRRRREADPDRQLRVSRSLGQSGRGWTRCLCRCGNLHPERPDPGADRIAPGGRRRHDHDRDPCAHESPDRRRLCRRRRQDYLQ